jgi:hypothetical protein
MTCDWQRETIGYHLSGMDSRLRIEAILEKLKKMETAVPALSESKKLAVINLPPSREYFQGELF